MSKYFILNSIYKSKNLLFGVDFMSCCSCCNNCSANSDTEDTNDVICCYPDNPFIGKYRVCCDCNGSCCGCFESNTRDCFWPEFSHPTWLCCELLYSCDSLECPEKERPIKAEDRFDDGICKKCRK